MKTWAVARMGVDRASVVTAATTYAFSLLFDVRQVHQPRVVLLPRVRQIEMMLGWHKCPRGPFMLSP